MENQTFYCLSQPSTKYVRSILELQNKRFWLSSHGWLVLSEKTQFHLWNPKSLESIYLSPLDLQPRQHVEGILLTSSPANPGSFLLLFLANPQSIAFCYIKDQRWTIRSCSKEEINIISGTDDGWRHFCLPIVCNGRIYATACCRRRLAEIEIFKQRLVIRSLHCQLPLFQSVCDHVKMYLVESDGDLFAINFEIHSREAMNIDVFNLDFPTRKWNRVGSCPDRAFFLSNDEAISCRIMITDIERMGNRVYFTRYQGTSLYSYHIEDKTISMSSPCPDLSTSWSTPIWVLPDPEGTEYHHHPGGDQKENGKKDIQVGANGHCETQEKLEEANRTNLNGRIRKWIR
ncbi:uncharacterized protein [Coffea arabica]|uniref:KIB1-4 beta-propeller domain-containing protein n=1 Tax=Coffea arabica TaxID=13443 RepID=A0ABM4UF61_COFAR